MHISFVKKIMADGKPCRKCADVEQRLRDADLFDKIDQVVIAYEDDPESEGMQLAKQYKVESAPFFIVENDDGATEVYTIYFKFLKEVLNTAISNKP